MAASPIVIYTDIASGPVSGGENNKGIYLSVFGKNFGDAGLGKSVRVYVGDVEVDNYRYLGVSRGRRDIQQITVQVGALGNPKMGVPLPVKVMVDGKASNTDVRFTPNPGAIFFVSPAGSDFRGKGTIVNPYRTVQAATIKNNGTPGCPAASGHQSIADAGVWGLVQPGDFIVMRAGVWTDISKDQFFLRVQNKSGSPPTGAVGTGPITIMGYPGEDVFVNRPNLAGNGEGGGGLSSADSARQAVGCGAWITISNLRIETGLNEGPINTQKGGENPAGSHWRVVNNEMSARGCNNNDSCKGGGVAGSGLGNFWVGNHVHDVHDKPDCCSSFENHGFYAEGPGSYEIAFNRIENIVGGNGVQTNANGGATIANVRIHHNVIDGVGKHGFNIADAGGSIMIYNNVVMNSDVAALRFRSENLAGARVFNNTFYVTDRLDAGGSRGALMNDSNLVKGALEIRNNIFVPGKPGRKFIGGSSGFGAVAAAISNNVWFNGRGALAGGANVTSDPLFVGAVAGAENLHLRSGSPAIDAGVPVPPEIVSGDFDVSTPRALGRAPDIGAYEFAQ